MAKYHYAKDPIHPSRGVRLKVTRGEQWSVTGDGVDSKGDPLDRWEYGAASGAGDTLAEAIGAYGHHLRKLLNDPDPRPPQSRR